MQLTQSQIIFDFDKTLATLRIEWQFWHEPIKQLITTYEPGFDPTTELDMSSIHTFIEKYGEKFRDAFVKIETTVEQNHYQGYIVIPQALALLQQLHRQDKQLYLLTSNSREVVIPILDELQITGYFKKIVTVSDVPNIKPSIAPFALIHDGSPKTDYLMVGDSVSDRGFAQNVGIKYLDVQEIEA